MPNKTGRAWKQTRATVHRKGGTTHSNKYSKHDTDHDRKPAPGTRDRIWVGGYTRTNGTHVEGHYRAA